MAKILPLPLPAAPSPPSCCPSGDGQSLQKRAVYTVWMKSLVFNGNGCTVYGAESGVAYRVDNYGCRGGRELFLMDRAGKTLIRIQRKGLPVVFRRWEACRYSDDGEETTTPWFRVQKKAAGKSEATVTMMHHGSGGSGPAYMIDGCARKSGYEVTGAGGAVAAEVEWKRTPLGAGGRCPDTDSRGRDGSSARLGFGGRLWPYESVLVMANRELMAEDSP